MGIPKETHLNCKFMHGTHFSFCGKGKIPNNCVLNVQYFLHFYIFMGTYWGVYVFIYMKCAALTHCQGWTMFWLMTPCSSTPQVKQFVTMKSEENRDIEMLFICNE